MAKDFAARLKTARLAEGLSQTDLAEKVGVTQPAVSNWELGNVEPRPPQLQQLERVLGNLSSGKREAEVDSTGQGDSSAFGAWLRKERTKAGKSVPELATASGVSTVAIYNIESGKSLNPQDGTRRRLAAALRTEVPVDVKEESEEEQQIQGLGSLTDFDPHDDDDLPTVSGVYVFYDVSDRPVYVGKAQNIAKRVGDHSDKFWFKYPIVSHAAYIEIGDDELRHQIEQILIGFLKSNAVINKQSVVRS
jgi:transcriptional regulator with XRE-family HTH domain